VLIALAAKIAHVTVIPAIAHQIPPNWKKMKKTLNRADFCSIFMLLFVI